MMSKCGFDYSYVDLAFIKLTSRGYTVKISKWHKLTSFMDNL